MNLTFLQAAIFFEDIVRNPAKKIQPIIEKCFDEKLEILNNIIPPQINLPMDFPIIQMKLKENVAWSINISQSRVDLILNAPVIDKEKKVIDFTFDLVPEEENHVEFLRKKVNKISERLMEVIEINRVGVVSRFFEEDENPSQIISKNILNSEYNNTSELNIQFNHKIEVENIKLNNMFQICEATIQKSIVDNLTSETLKGVMISRDINNVPSEDEVLKLENIETIIQKGLYFPNNKKIIEKG